MLQWRSLRIALLVLLFNLKTSGGYRRHTHRKFISCTSNQEAINYVRIKFGWSYFVVKAERSLDTVESNQRSRQVPIANFLRYQQQQQQQQQPNEEKGYELAVIAEEMGGMKTWCSQRMCYQFWQYTMRIPRIPQYKLLVLSSSRTERFSVQSLTNFHKFFSALLWYRHLSSGTDVERGFLVPKTIDIASTRNPIGIVDCENRWPQQLRGYQLGNTLANFEHRYANYTLLLEYDGSLVNVINSNHGNDVDDAKAATAAVVPIDTAHCAQFITKASHRRAKRSGYDATDFIKCMCIYSELNNGSLVVANRFKVPAQQPWPQRSWGVNLYDKVRNVRRGHCTISGSERAMLDSIGFEWDPFGAKDRKLLAAMRTFAAVYGHLNVPQKYTVPANGSDPRFPIETWGMRLGRKVNHIRTSGTHKNIHDELLRLGFCF